MPQQLSANVPLKIQTVPIIGFLLVGFRFLFTAPLSHILMLIACIIYALFSEPTPEQFSVTEASIAFLLVLSVISSGFFKRLPALSFSSQYPAWMWAGLIYVGYSLIFPTLVALQHNNGVMSIARDIISLLFWAMPVLFIGFFALSKRRHNISPQPRSIRPESLQAEFLHAESLKAKSLNAEKILILSLVIIGFTFSLRFLLSLINVTGIVGIAPSHPDIPLELVNVPSVLFAAIFLFGYGVIYLYKGIAYIPRGIVFLAVSLIPIIAGISAVQRANMGSIFFISAVLIAAQISKSPRRSILPICFLFGVIVYLWPQISDVVFIMLEKTRLVGFNQRFEEADAIQTTLNEYMSNSIIGFIPWQHIFGLGWGASFVSPAAGYIEITFSHSLITTLWLKSGAIGVLLGTAYFSSIIICLARAKLPIHRHKKFEIKYLEDIVLKTALMLPILINIFLYANHKSFDFGLLLLLAVLFNYHRMRRQKYS